MTRTYTRLVLIKKSSKLYGNYACCLAFLFQSPTVLALATAAILIHGVALYFGHPTYT